MHNALSSDVTEVLKVQGFNALFRKAVSYAPVSLNITQKGESEIYINQSTTASIPAVKEEWYPADHEWREQKDAVFGKLKSRSRWVKISELQNGGAEAFLIDGLDGGEEVIEAEVESLDDGWRAVQVWLFEHGRFVRRVVTTREGGERRVETKLVYEFVG